MAKETVNIDLIINASQSAKTLKEQREALKSIRDGLDNVKEGSGAFELLNEEATRLTSSMDNLTLSFEDVYGQGVKPLSSQLGELEDRMYQMALAGDTTSDSFKEIQQEAIRMRKTIIDVDASVDAFADKGARLNSFIGIVSGIAGAFAVAQGAAALFGSENEEVQKSLLKVQAVLAILNGLQEINRLITEKNIIVQKILNSTMLKNPIFIILAVLTAVTAAWALLTRGIDNNEKALKKQSETNIKVISDLKREEEQNKKLGLSIDEVRDKRIAAEKVQIKIQEKQLAKLINDLKIAEIAYQTTQDNLNSSIPEAIWFRLFGTSKKDLTDLKDKLKETSDAYKDSSNSVLVDEKTAADEKIQILINQLERERALQETRGKETIALDRRILDLKLTLYNKDSQEYKNVINEKSILEVNYTKKIKTQTEDRIKLQEEYQKKYLDIIENINDREKDLTNELYLNLEEGVAKELALIEVAYGEKLDLIEEQQKNDIAEAEKAGKGLLDINKKYSDILLMETALFKDKYKTTILLSLTESNDQFSSDMDKNTKLSLRRIELEVSKSIDIVNEGIKDGTVDYEAGEVKKIAILEVASKSKQTILDESYEEQTKALKSNSDVYIKITKDRLLKAQKEEEEAQNRLNEATEIGEKMAITGAELNFSKKTAITKELSAELVKLETENRNNLLTIEEDYYNKSKDNAYDSFEALKEIAKTATEETINFISQITINSLNLINSIQNSITQNKLSNIERERTSALEAVEAEENAYNKSIENKTNKEKAQEIIAEKFENKKRAIEKAATLEKNEAEYKGQIQSWEFSKAQAIVNLSNAVLKAAPNPFLVGTTIALGFVELATITANKPVKNFATGGLVLGEGTGTSDSIPANLSNGEFVINAKATAANLPILQAINKNGGKSQIVNTPQSSNNNMVQVAQVIDTSRLEALIEMVIDRPIKTYVVSSDITSSQNSDNRLKDRITF